MHMYVCMHVCIYIYIYIYRSAIRYTIMNYFTGRRPIPARLHPLAGFNTCMCVYIYIYIYTYTLWCYLILYDCTLYVYTHMYVCIYIYTHTYSTIHYTIINYLYWSVPYPCSPSPCDEGAVPQRVIVNLTQTILVSEYCEASSTLQHRETEGTPSCTVHLARRSLRHH